ncbi:MAG: ECF transporter S component [Ruminococcaceae bacterium]|nr:ECF transporter S component [Oscillospiraceae bacterium]
MNQTQKKTRKISILAMTQLAILTAIVFVLQMLGSVIRIGPTSISLVLLPIVIGAIILGPGAGAFLGFIFGLITFWAGVSGTDFFTFTLFSAQPVATALICIGKGTAAGLAAGLVYKLMEKKNQLIASILAAAAAPIVNTGLFILGGLTLVADTLSATFVSGTTLIYFLVIGCAGLNFVVEFLVNLIVSPAIYNISCAIAKISSRTKQ